MKRILSIALLLAGLNGSWVNMVAAQPVKSFELMAPRELAGGETIELQITTGPLPPSARIVVTTAQGEALGAIVPYALPGQDKGSTATIAVPQAALVDRRLRVQLQVVEQGKPPRAPDTDEVRRVNLVLSPKP
ncbi:hypothetical protein [Bradyrhizobium sp. LTSP885]|uniref:hypothetical protein n=1 Tax=Bradyrhizobium sp. LTSP885 TaxID=1619232 RepID=UPI00069B8D81|nr:hypothetical protein [Bradyrhizobium sp. LTSP885]